jgi:hypothetical protein
MSDIPDSRPSSLKIKSTHTMSCDISELTAGMVKEFLHEVDDSAKLSVKIYYSDRPGEISAVTMSADVDISKGRIY